jgi:hypothetical protein
MFAGHEDEVDRPLRVYEFFSFFFSFFFLFCFCFVLFYIICFVFALYLIVGVPQVPCGWVGARHEFLCHPL